MDIILYGAGKIGKRVLERTKEYEGINVIGFADTYKKGEYEGYPIIELQQEIETFAETPVVLTLGGFVETRREVYQHLKKIGIRHIYYYWNKAYCSGDDFLRDECILLEPKSENVLFYAEMSIIDYCNLNCKGCNHYAAIFPKQLPDIETRLDDVRRIKDLYDEVIEFGLIGGEPLLNPEVDLYIERVKELLPNTKLQMVTNGLLIPAISEGVLQCIKEYGVLVVISEYVPTSKMINKITDRLREFEIDYEIRSVDVKKKFYKTLSLKKDSIYPKKCISLGCTNICDGKIARCPTALYINKLNQRFGTDFPSEGVYQLSDYQDGKRLNMDLSKKIPLCDYCIEYVFDWEPCGKNVALEDFVVDE